MADKIDHQPLIEIVAVNKSYVRASERLQVLSDLNLKISAGEFIGLMGPSGSGKTTLLNLVAGLDRPDSGSITIGGVAIEELDESKLARWRSRNVGFIFQFYNLVQVLTARDNVALPLALFSMSAAERIERANFALEIVGLADRADHIPNQLSGGQQQRVAIARALVTDPVVIVADEPTGDLDRKSANEVMTLLKSLNQEYGKTIVMVTHDLHMAEFCTRVVQLDGGKIVTNL